MLSLRLSLNTTFHVIIYNTIIQYFFGINSFASASYLGFLAVFVVQFHGPVAF